MGLLSRILKKRPRIFTRYCASISRRKLNVKAIEASVAIPRTGAVVTFIGLTRDEHSGRRVLTLEYEAQETLALQMLKDLADEAISKFGLTGVAVHHRLGRVKIGEASVVIAVSSAHRGAAFDGCRYLIDTLKTTVPIFKKEYYADGSPPEWVGPDGKPVIL